MYCDVSEYYTKTFFKIYNLGSQFTVASMIWKIKIRERTMIWIKGKLNDLSKFLLILEYID